MPLSSKEGRGFTNIKFLIDCKVIFSNVDNVKHKTAIGLDPMTVLLFSPFGRESVRPSAKGSYSTHVSYDFTDSPSLVSMEEIYILWFIF